MHQYRREDGLGEHAMHTRMRPIFERHGIKPPSMRAIGRHLTSHVDYDIVPDKDNFDLPDPEEVAFERLAAAEGELKQIAPSDVALGKNDSDYHNMADLFRRLMRRIAALDADPTAFVNPDGQHSMQRLNTWSNMVSNAKSIIEGLNKMRNSDRMTVSILEQHTKRYATAIAAPIADVVRSVRDDLAFIDHPKARELELRLTILLEQGVPGIFRDAAVRSLRESREKYKLLN